MRHLNRWSLIAGAAAVAAALLASCSSMMPAKSGMGFFVTSVNPGQGGNLGGLAGADAHCQQLATAAGAGSRSWRAYLSAQPSNSGPGANARDRIGRGPWSNAKGVLVASDLDQLHGSNQITKQTALTERGAVINGRGDSPNTHDVLTGSQPNGNFIAGEVNSTCGNWTMSDQGAAMVGHHDRSGLDDSTAAKSWNSSHQSRGCSADQLKSTGGSGLFYCFAAD